uniref:Secreted protein n=1 Tax=Ditylenchus dipsaci TaxID=166011 RepID=A0A915DJQ0_9BILA
MIFCLCQFTDTALVMVTVSILKGSLDSLTRCTKDGKRHLSLLNVFALKEVVFEVNPFTWSVLVPRMSLFILGRAGAASGERRAAPLAAPFDAVFSAAAAPPLHFQSPPLPPPLLFFLRRCRRR